VVGYGPFSLCVIHKAGLCLSGGGINRLMMIQDINRLLIIMLVPSQVVGNSLKSLEVSEEKANQRVEEFKKQLKTLTAKLKEAEARAEFAEKTVKKLQKEVDRLEGMCPLTKTFKRWILLFGYLINMTLKFCINYTVKHLL
jgi:DNA repair exonuclease SbcCD ATPase subunit